MTGSLGRRFLLWGLLAASAAALGFAAAGASSVEATLVDGLRESAAPALLGPISEGGRVGWKCKPERAATAKSWQDAELPSDVQER